MKKTLAIIAILLCIFGTSIVCATNGEKISNNTKNIDTQDSSISQIVDFKAKEKKTLEDYKEAYGSDAYGLTAYVLGRIQIYSIPFCFLGIALSAIYQYVLGIRKLDTRDKGFAIMISVITLLNVSGSIRVL